MAKRLTRPIKSERDYQGASTVAKNIRGQAGREPAAERRLQALIDAMEKFDDGEDEAADDGQEDVYDLPRRRWSDDTSEME